MAVISEIDVTTRLQDGFYAPPAAVLSAPRGVLAVHRALHTAPVSTIDQTPTLVTQWTLSTSRIIYMIVSKS